MQNLRRLLAYARRQRRFVVLIPSLTVTSSLFAALQPWPLKFLTDHVLGQAPLPDFLGACLRAAGIQPTPTTLLLLVVLGGLLLFTVSAALDYALTWTWTKAGRRMVLDLAEDLFARLQRRSLIFHRRSSVGDLLERVMADSWVVHKIVDALFFAPVHALLITTAMAFFMWQLDGWLTVAALVTPPLMVAASLPLGRRIQAAAKTKRETEVHLRSHVQQTLSGISVVQAFAQEEREHERFERFAEAAVRAQRQTALVTSLNGLNQGLVTTLGTGVVLWLGTLHVLDGRITVGSLLVFLVYLNQLQAQMKVFAAIYPSLMGYRASEHRVMEVLAAPVEVDDKPGAVSLPPVQGRVCLENVTFGYEPGRAVLHNVSLEANPGEVIAIVGPTGAGKSTLVGLVPRFFDPWQGRVLIDGCDVRDVKLKTLRDQVALVLQEPFLFPLSIGDNIAYGRPAATPAHIEAAARSANAHDFIMRLPQGYQTVIGERGATLSGGERQRISIARALLKDAPVLILDEPTSALDAGTESLLLQALERLMKGRSTFIIAHRLSTVRRADRIVVLQNGRVTESGTHDELLARGGFYSHLQHLQSARATVMAIPAA